MYEKKWVYSYDGFTLLYTWKAFHLVGQLYSNKTNSKKKPSCCEKPDLIYTAHSQGHSSTAVGPDRGHLFKLQEFREHPDPDCGRLEFVLEFFWKGSAFYLQNLRESYNLQNLRTLPSMFYKTCTNNFQLEELKQTFSRWNEDTL